MGRSEATGRVQAWIDDMHDDAALLISDRRSRTHDLAHYRIGVPPALSMLYTLADKHDPDEPPAERSYIVLGALRSATSSHAKTLACTRAPMGDEWKYA
jgi:hypothetical protein